MTVNLKKMAIDFIKLLLIFSSLAHIVTAQEEEEVDILVTKDLPKNKTLITLPRDLSFKGDNDDCCVLVLWFQVKDVEPDSGQEPPELEKNETEKETDRVIFRFYHPQIRKDTNIFSMDVNKEEEKVTNRHLINFDKCSTMKQVTFDIYANTTLMDERDVNIVMRNGKDEDLTCTAITTTKKPSVLPTPDPKEHMKNEATEMPPFEVLGMNTISIVLLVALVISVCGSGIMCFKLKTFKEEQRKTNQNVDRRLQSLERSQVGNENEKCMGGGDEDVEKSRSLGPSTNVPNGILDWVVKLKKENQPLLVISVILFLCTFIFAIATVFSVV